MKPKKKTRKGSREKLAQSVDEFITRSKYAAGEWILMKKAHGDNSDN
jgi:hypothetical protein